MRESTLENVGGQIPTPRSAKRAIGDDPRVRHSLDRRRDVRLTAFADDDKGMEDAGGWCEHENSIGEYKANISTRERNVALHQ